MKNNKTDNFQIFSFNFFKKELINKVIIPIVIKMSATLNINNENYII